jgi:hypothetical protein
MALFFFISQEQKDLSNISQETRLQNSNLRQIIRVTFGTRVNKDSRASFDACESAH